MAALRNPQEERATQHLAAGFRMPDEERAKRGLRPDCTLQEEAAAIMGLDPSASSFRANARKTCQRKVIRERVAEIQYAGSALASVSGGSLLVAAEQVREGALKAKEFAAANSAIVTKATLAGFWRNRVEATGKDGAPLPAMPMLAPTIIITGNPNVAPAPSE